jgi:hypothetical protein
VTLSEVEGSRPVNAKAPSRSNRGERWVAIAAGLVALLLITPTSATELLEVVLDEVQMGDLQVGLRDAKGEVPSVLVDDLPIDLVVKSRTPSIKWQPVFLIVDSTNIEQARLDKVKRNVTDLLTRELRTGSRLVVLSDQSGGGAEVTSIDSLDKVVKPTLESWELVVNPDTSRKPKPYYSTISMFLAKRLSNVPMSKARPWALVYSSLCVSPEDKPAESMKGFKGPIRFLTWDTGLHPKCLENRTAWLEAVRAIREIEVYNVDDPEQAAAIEAALQGRNDVSDEVVHVEGVPYGGGIVKLAVKVEGQDAWTNTFKEYTGAAAGEVPHAWFAAAQEAQQRKVRLGAALAFGILVIVVILLALYKARSGGLEVAKWEIVGEAEDLSSSMDPDAWNATIFQLTGAMPALKEVRKAAQLGPADEVPAARKKKGEPTVDAPSPAGASDTSASPTVKPTEDLPSTGMTVAMPVLDDGTGYDAETPFEIGVLLSGKPVARKTKKFRKVFSIGRATDNRVVIQKDDTVHRYHVVVRPALQGKEWWLEVSPTSTNRTNLNGKDLRPGGRYRLPARFRLQLGEATEVRGRLAKDK